jgi:hypothetical protein
MQAGRRTSNNEDGSYRKMSAVLQSAADEVQSDSDNMQSEAEILQSASEIWQFAAGLLGNFYEWEERGMVRPARFELAT